MIRVLLCKSWCAIALSVLVLAGCSAVRFSSTLPPSPEEPPEFGSTKFGIAAIDGAIDRETFMQVATERYPDLFSEDWTAVPITVDVQETRTQSAGWAALVTILTLGTLPCPQTDRGDYVVTTAVTDEEGARVCDTNVNFVREDVSWTTLFTPLGLIPVCGEATISRESWVDMNGTQPYTDRAKRYTTDCIVQAVLTALKSVDATKLQAVAQARRDRLQEVVINGERRWTFLAPAFSKRLGRQEKADLYLALLYREQPARTTKPIESVLVARRGKDGRWQTLPAYVRSANSLTAACALLENGTPTRLVLKEVPEPPLEDFIDIPSHGGDEPSKLAAIRWSNHVLVQVKNRTLPGMLRERRPDELLDLATRIESVILDLNLQAELAKDQAQRLIETGGDPGGSRERALIYRERISVFKPIVIALKQAVAFRER